MKLTDALFRLSNHIKFHHVPGNILLGKYRIWPKLNPKYKRYLLRKIDTEIDNMKMIARPYLPEAESKLIEQVINDEQKQKAFEEKLNKIRANKNKMEDRHMSEHLDCLRSHRVWE